MATVNLTNVPFDPTLRDTTSDTGSVDQSGAAGAATVQGALPATGIHALERSAFDGTKATVGSNVLSTPPPALGGGQTSPVNYAEAMGRMDALQGQQPFHTGLMRSAEDGTAPALPAQYQAGGTVASTAAQAQNLTAQPAAASTQNVAQESTSSATAQDGGQTINLDNRDNNVNVGDASEDLRTAADTIQSDAAKGHEKKCNRGTDHTGEKQLTNRLREMGLDKKQAQTIARFMNDNNIGTNSNHNAKDENTVALAIAAYDKLNSAGSKDAAKQVVSELKNVADNFNDSVKTTKASDAYYTSMNVLGGYVMQASANAAVKSLDSTTGHSQVKIVPYPTVVLD